jgi:type I restriction enzyme, R subunit
VPLKALLEAVAVGTVDEDILASLARRLGLLEKRLTGGQRQEVERLLDVPAAPERFHSLRELSNALLDAIDPDRVEEITGAGAPAEEVETARQRLVQRAVIPLAASPGLRAFLQEREILIDETSVDEVLEAGMDADASARARQLVDSFRDFIQEHKDEITALQILFNRPRAQRLEFGQLRELAEQLRQHLNQSDPLFMTGQLWSAYQQLEKDRVRGAGERRILADLVSLVRHAALEEDLEPHTMRVERRYREWLGEREFTPQQRWWLDEIARHIGINVSISLADLNAYGFARRGGQVAAQRVFGAELPALVEEINTSLSA